MLSTVPEHGDSLVPSGKINRNKEEMQQPECVFAYNVSKKRGRYLRSNDISYSIANKLQMV